MIEVNLLPDVKRELLKAVRVRNTVVSLSIILSIVTLGILGLILLWMGAQEIRDKLTSDGIAEQSKRLKVSHNLIATLKSKSGWK